MADGAPLVHPDWESYEGDEALGARRQHARLLDDRQGRRRRGDGAADVVVSGRYVTDPVQGVPIEPRAIIAAVAGRQGHGLVVDAGAVRRARRASRDTLQMPESHVRVIVPLLGGGFGAKCDFHFEGHVAALARAARPAGEARLLAARGVLRRRPSPRGDGDRARDRRAQGRHARRAPRPARARQGRLLRRGRLLRADGGDARAAARTRSRTSTSTRTSTTRTTSRRRRSARRPRRRSAGRSSSTWTSSPRRSSSTRSSSAAAR